jgi:hypothetical protein
MVVLMGIVTVKVRLKALPHGSIHSKRRAYAVYYYRMELQLTNPELAAIT